jgi:hypothetical protein
VFFHSPDLGELTGCDGPVADRSFSEISDCSYRGVYKQKLCTPEYLFENISIAGKHFVFDCKTTSLEQDYIDSFTGKVKRLIDRFGLADQCFIESPTPGVISSFHRRDTLLKLFLYTDTCSIGLEATNYLPLYGLVMDWKKVTSEEIRQAHKKNLRITLFNTTTESENLKAVQMSPDYIQTDKLEHLLKIYEMYKR